MKKIGFFLGSFRVKIALALVLSMLFVGAVSNLLIYKFALNSQFEQLRDKLKVIAQTASLTVDGDMIREIPLTREGMDTAQYKIIAQKLSQIQELSPPIRYVYVMAKTGQKDILQFVVDPSASALSEEEKKKGLTSYPGDKYNAARFPEMLKAFDAASADKKLGADEWGMGLSGYAPIRDKSGKAVAILAVDIMAGDVHGTQRQVHHRALFVLFLGVIISVIAGALLSERIIRPIKKLVAATGHIAKGNLRYQVEVRGSNEIEELACSFNRMALSLFESRRKLRAYFYSIVQSLVRIMEARDHYTKGHSERVSLYAEKIALMMGFPSEKVELLKETALLHDIGKMGIQDNILNKKEKVTEEEWEIIRKHPVIGEEILKPVLLNEEMLAIVRGHHERWDGKGYPDKLSGEGINIFAQILSVADAYDAMTSSRAYRPALDKKQAVEELVKTRGSQFDARVVDVFLKVLEAEGVKLPSQAGKAGLAGLRNE